MGDGTEKLMFITDNDCVYTSPIFNAHNRQRSLILKQDKAKRATQFFQPSGTFLPTVANNKINISKVVRHPLGLRSEQLNDYIPQSEVDVKQRASFFTCEPGSWSVTNVASNFQERALGFPLKHIIY